MKIYYLSGTGRQASLSQRLIAGLAVVAGLGLFALLLTVGLVVGLIALGLGVLAIAVASLRQRWRGAGAARTQQGHERSNSPSGTGGTPGPRAVIDGEYVVVSKPGTRRSEQQRQNGE